MHWQVFLILLLPSLLGAFKDVFDFNLLNGVAIIFFAAWISALAYDIYQIENTNKGLTWATHICNFLAIVATIKFTYSLMLGDRDMVSYSIIAASCVTSMVCLSITCRKALLDKCSRRTSIFFIFISLALFPIGIWFLQPRLNAFAEIADEMEDVIR